MRIVSAAIVVLLTTGILSTASKVMSEPSEVRDHGIAFGRSRHFSGIYVSTMEGSRFVECDRSNDVACMTGYEGNDGIFAGVRCAPSACLDIEKRTKQLVGSYDIGALYALDFIGRRSTHETPTTFIGDTKNKVYVERITYFAVIKTH
jgi:hypothetical protein